MAPVTLTCPECSAQFTPTNGRQAFCTPKHKANFHHVMAHRGQMLMPLALASRDSRRVKGSKSDLQGWSRTQMCNLLDSWNAADRKAGRQPQLVAQAKLDMRWLAIDVDTK